jgi:hypothetical protein
MMSKVFLTFHSSDTPSVSAMKERFALTDDDIDTGFGIVEVDPDAHLYTALVESNAASRVSGSAPDTKTHSNPTISAFDLPDAGRDNGSR